MTTIDAINKTPQNALAGIRSLLGQGSFYGLFSPSAANAWLAGGIQLDHLDRIDSTLESGVMVATGGGAVVLIINLGEPSASPGASSAGEGGE